MRRQRQGEFGILVDNQTAWENVCRTAEGRSWVVKENCEIDDYFKIIVASDA